MKKWHIVLSLIFLIIVVGYVDNNLKTNSVYYAKHMPHCVDTLPEAIMLIDYMEEVYTPEIEGIEYDIDGTKDIIDDGAKKAFGSIYREDTEYVYTNNTDAMYTFNKKMQLIHITDTVLWQSIPVDNIDTKVLVQEIREFLSPIVDAQPEPKVNLQWLFNLIYQGQFE